MTKLYDIHTHNPLSEDMALYSVRLGVEPMPTNRLCSAGIHPWDIEKVDIEREITNLKNAEIKAVGECGLDYTISLERDIQMSVFEEHIRISKLRNLPIIIHSVKANSDVVKMLKRSTIDNVIFHSFIGSTEQVNEIVRNGWFLSLGPHSFRSSRTIEIIKSLPSEFMLLETDESKDGVSPLYDKVAEIRNESLGKLKDDIKQNWIKIFESTI